MSLVKLPHGAGRMAKAPSSVAWGPLVGKPSDTSVVDEAAFWRVPMAYAFLTSWVPARLQRSGERPLAIGATGPDPRPSHSLDVGAEG